jgi:dihydroflavonol-4-reductase
MRGTTIPRATPATYGGCGMTSRALVTGATGFLGGALVGSLVGSGRSVRALVRSDAAAARMVALGVEPVFGDLLDRSALEAGLAGCDVVYHVAGVNAFCLPDPRPLFEVNVAGSRALAMAAAAAGVGRLVYTSSAATMDGQSAATGRPGVEPRFLSRYAQSKTEAEGAVFEVADQTGLAVVCVNPASVQGPGRTSGTARLLIGYLNGTLRVAVDGALNVVDIADCTRGHILAAERGVPGERYLLCGASTTLRAGLQLLGRLTGIDDAPRFLPPGVAFAAAAGVEVVARARRRRSSFCREMVRTLIEGHAYDGSGAARDLGLTYTPVETTMRRTIAWYIAQGLVTRPLPGFTSGTAEDPELPPAG